MMLLREAEDECQTMQRSVFESRCTTTDRGSIPSAKNLKIPTATGRGFWAKMGVEFSNWVLNIYMNSMCYMKLRTIMGCRYASRRSIWAGGGRQRCRSCRHRSIIGALMSSSATVNSGQLNTLGSILRSTASLQSGACSASLMNA
jgi:hypothetical protein